MKWTATCADRETGQSYKIIVEADSEREATDKAAGGGHLVGQVELVNPPSITSSDASPEPSPSDRVRYKGDLVSDRQAANAILLILAIVLGLIAVGLLFNRGQFSSDNAVGETANLLGDVRSLLVLILAVLMLLLRALICTSAGK